MHLVLKPQPDTRPDQDFFYVCDTDGTLVGRIYQKPKLRASISSKRI
jgi:hypothetical protein